MRVLHLEDDVLDAELIHERFQAREPGRWNFVHVTSREAFEAALGRGPYDLAIMDHDIPGYDGMVALQEAHRRLPGTPIIVLSGSPTEEDAVECLKAGATDYVLKSRMQRLLAAAERALEEARLRRERERAEAELRAQALNAELRAQALNAELQRRVEDRTTELRLANRDLDAFSFLVSHDLRAPLRAVSGFTALLRDELGADLAGDKLHYIERIENGCRRMERQIGDILSLAQVSRAEMMPADIPLSSLAEEALATLRAGDPAREVESRVEPGLRAHADLRLLRAVLAELLGNAWKFSAGRTPARIEFGLGSATGLLSTYFVRDNGAGFDPRLSEKLFTPFQRLHAEEDFPGAGVGLARARRAIERHGGNMWAEGRPGEGATFHFSLPKPPRAPGA